MWAPRPGPDDPGGRRVVKQHLGRTQGETTMAVLTGRVAVVTGVKAWVVCPGFVDTDMGYVIPGANPASFLKVDEVVDVVRFLLHTGDNVKLGPEILVRTMRNPMTP
jgi:hypothetical protein